MVVKFWQSHIVLQPKGGTALFINKHLGTTFYLKKGGDE